MFEIEVAIWYGLWNTICILQQLNMLFNDFYNLALVRILHH